MELDARLQPHLGRPETRYKPHDDLNMLAIAKVIKIHHKHGTVDLQLIKSNNVISSDSNNEGKYGARVLTASANFDAKLMSSSGVIEPIQEGQMVLVAFVDGLKNQPVVIGSFHQTWDVENNVLPEIYPLRPEDSIAEMRDATKYLRVHPSQFYERVDAIGSKEVSHPSKTFLQVDPDLYGEITDKHATYDHKDLSEKDPYTGSTRSARTEEAAYPVNVLFVHRSDFDDEVTTWTKLFINSSGMFRLTRDNNDGSLSYLELSEDGSTKIRRQIGNPNHGEGDDYTELGFEVDGTLSLNRVIDGKQSSISLEENGDLVLQHKDGAFMKITENGIITGGNGESAGSMIVVSKVENPDWADGTFWIDTSDIEG